MDTRRIHINKLTDLNEYKRIIFSDCEYFSFLDVYIGSIYLGTKFRIHEEQINEFAKMESKKKIDLHVEAALRKQSLSDLQKGELIMRQYNS